MRYPVVLASASPRRIELLRSLVEDFEVLPADVDEGVIDGETPRQTARRLAAMKARAVALVRPEALVIGGDTVVAFKTRPGQALQLAKPIDEADARRMLGLLSGRTHEVITGVHLVWPEGERTFDEVSRVTFRPLGADEIRAYVATGEPMDKAGAYAVQAGGGTFIERIEGSRTNVIGLPMERLEIELSAVRRDTSRT